jgi:hypothetical protein
VVLCAGVVQRGPADVVGGADAGLARHERFDAV